MRRLLASVAAAVVLLASAVVGVSVASTAPAGADHLGLFCEWVFDGNEWQLHCPIASVASEPLEYGIHYQATNFMAEGVGSDTGGLNVTIDVWNYCGHPETGTNADNCYVIHATGRARGDANVYDLYYAALPDSVFISSGGGDAFGYVHFNIMKYTGNTVTDYMTWNEDTDELGCGSWVTCGHGIKAVEYHAGPPSEQNQPYYPTDSLSEYNTGFAREVKVWQHDSQYNVWWSTMRVYLGCDC